MTISLLAVGGKRMMFQEENRSNFISKAFGIILGAWQKICYQV